MNDNNIIRNNNNILKNNNNILRNNDTNNVNTEEKDYFSSMNIPINHNNHEYDNNYL